MAFDYEKYQKEQIKALGLDPDKLTADQIFIVLEPSEAPENFMCDGELTYPQAVNRWTRKMREAGFTELEMFNIKRKLGL